MKVKSTEYTVKDREGKVILSKVSFSEYTTWKEEHKEYKEVRRRENEGSYLIHITITVSNC